MHRPAKYRPLRGFAFVSIAVLFSMMLAGNSSAEELQLHFRNGDVVTFDVQTPTIGWTSVGMRGDMKRVEIPLSEIGSINLTTSPASEQLAKIRTLIAQLSSQVYLERQRAEEELRVAGRRFRKLLEQESEVGTAEAKYRLSRVVSHLSKSRKDDAQELDRLSYANGKSIDGDAGQFSLRCMYRGDEIEIERSDLMKIMRPRPALDAADNGIAKKVEVEMFHSHEKFVDRKTQREIDFSKSADGKTLSRENDVAEEYTEFGLKFDTPNKKGFVGVSGYPFKFNGIPVGGNSICVYRTRGQSLRFQGEMEIGFCMPGQPGVPAGVNEFGLFLARVQHSRDFIMEAYDETGHLLATVESTDQQCSFHGLRSSQPIAKIRILSNPYLDKVTRVVDKDYAVDTIYVSKKPVPIRGLGSSKKLSFRNGDSLTPQGLKFTDDGSVEFSTADGLQRSVGIGELTMLGFADEKNSAPPEVEGNWKILLEDGSVLIVEPGKTFKSSLVGREFKPEEVAAVWPASEKLRYPVNGDFKRGPTVLVYPTCRIATLDIEFIKDGFVWREADKLEANLILSKNGKDDDTDPTPDGKAEYYSDKKPQNQPTVWLREPMTLPRSQGMIRLLDGQAIAYGDRSLFSLEAVSPSDSKANGIAPTVGVAPTIVVKFGDTSVTIDGAKIKSISPAK